MLQSIRDRATGWIAWVIVILIAVPFALWGIQEYFGPGGQVPAATVNGVELPEALVMRGVQDERRQLQQMFGGRNIPGLMDDEVLYRGVLARLVEREVLRQAVQGAGYRVGDEALAQRIASFDAFLNEGRFDQAAYQRALLRMSESPASFEQRMRQDLVMEQFYSGVTGSAFLTAAEEARAAALQGQKRDISYLRVKAEELAARAEVGEEEVKAYFGAHRDAFMEPEQVKVAYLELNMADLMEGVEVDEGQLRTLYEERKGSFGVGEQRRTRHILLELPEGAPAEQESEVRTRAEQLVADLRGGADFAAIAAERSMDPGSAAQGGDLGWVGPGVMDPAFEAAAFALEKDEISDPVRTPYGYHVIQVTDVRPGEEKSFTEVRDELEQEYRRHQVERRYGEQVETLVNLSFENPQSLQPAAEALGLELHQSEWFSREEGDGLASDGRVRAAAFEEEVLERGFNSGAVELSDEHMAVLRIVDRKSAAQKALATVHDEIVARLRAEQGRRLAREEGERLLARLDEGTGIDQLAPAGADAVRHLGMTGRYASAEGDEAVVKAAFRLPKPTASAVHGGEALPNGDYAVIVVTRVEEGPAAVAGAAGDQRRRDLGNREFEALAAVLKGEAEIEYKKAEP